MIAYKVVTNKRESAYVGSAICYNNEERITRKRYLMRYSRGQIIEAPKDSLGIFCFDTLENAEEFMRIRGDMILEVEPLTKVRRVEKIVKSVFLFDEYYSRLKGGWGHSGVETVPEGTICFDKVKVLD